MPSILTVCQANVCRSPLASHELASVLSERAQLKGTDFASAGLAASEGAPTCELVVARVTALSGRSAAALRVEDVRAATLILTLEESQRGAVSALLPGSQLKTFTLTEAADLAEEAVRRGSSGLGLRQITATLHALRGQVPVARRRWRAVPSASISDGHGASNREHRRTIARVSEDSRRLGEALAVLASTPA